MTRLGDLMHFGQRFKACGNNYFAQPLLYNFCKGFKNFKFSSEIIFGQLLETFGDFLLVTLVMWVNEREREKCLIPASACLWIVRSKRGRAATIMSKLLNT